MGKAVMASPCECERSSPHRHAPYGSARVANRPTMNQQSPYHLDPRAEEARFGMPRKPKPGRLGYVLAGLVGAGGIAAFVLLLIETIGVFTKMEMHRFTGPGQRRMTLSTPGRYTIFREFPPGDSKRSPEAARPEGLRLVLTEAGTGRGIPVTKAGASTYYSSSQRSGVSIAGFELASPGEYVLEASYAEGAAEQPISLAVGQVRLARFLGLLAAGIGTLLATLFAAILIAVATFARRRADDREAAPDDRLTGMV